MTQDKSKQEMYKEVAKLFDKPIAHLAEHHFTEPQPIKCKWCGSTDIIKRGVDDGVQEYTCNKCGRRFSDKDAPYGMRTTVDQIGASLAMYYDGLSLADIARQLDITYHNPVDRSTIYRWLMRFTAEAIALLDSLKPKVSDTWVADETVIQFEKDNYWLWDIIDSKTRFLLASYLSPKRGTREARILMETASERAGIIPKRVITDKLAGYLDGIELAFGADTKHIQSSPFDKENDSNLIERFQGTIKDRTKVLRGFKTLTTATIIIKGFLVHYNFFRPHISLGNQTPAQVAGIKAPVKNWTELVRKVGRIA